MTEVVKTPEALTGYLNPVLAIVTGDANDTMTVKQARLVFAAGGVAGAAAGSVIARQRQAAGKAPYGKIFF